MGNHSVMSLLNDIEQYLKKIQDVASLAELALQGFPDTDEVFDSGILTMHIDMSDLLEKTNKELRILVDDVLKRKDYVKNQQK